MTEEAEVFSHVPVMPEEVLEHLVPAKGPCRIVDCTVGYGGHSSLILRKNGEAELLGLDRDGDAISGARKVLGFASARVHLERGEFSSLEARAREAGWSQVDAVLMDLGVSSPQIDNPQRGFSFRQDGPLDMRMDRRSPVSASRILNTFPEGELARIFREYGEIRQAGRLARAIVERRAAEPWAWTAELARLCEKVLGRQRPGGPPAPTLCFQALRMAVNRELEELSATLEAACSLLKRGGRMGVISFHSLEDRIVKDFIREKSGFCKCPPKFPECRCAAKAELKALFKKPLRPSESEVAANRRAAPARFRVAEKIC